MKKFYRIFAILFAVISLIGLISFLAGTRSVNLGAFLCPLVMALVFFVLYLRS